MVHPPRDCSLCGQLGPSRQFGEVQAAVVVTVKLIKRNLTTGDGVVDTIHEVKLWDNLRALEMLAKHFGLIKERVEHQGSLEVVDILKGRLERAKTRGKA